MKGVERPLLLAICLLSIANTYGFDYSSACSRPYRSSRSKTASKVPCDLTKQSYCNLPGAMYPWHAVRRFVHENQGLMRRMYGEQRHISVLKAEIGENDIDDSQEALEDDLKMSGNLAEDIIKTKLMYTKKATPRAMDIKTVPHFRPVQPSASTEAPNPEIQEPTLKESVNNKNKISAEPQSDNISNETSEGNDKTLSYKTSMLYKESTKLDSIANIEINNIEPDIMTLEAAIKQSIETNSVFPNYSSTTKQSESLTNNISTTTLTNEETADDSPANTTQVPDTTESFKDPETTTIPTKDGWKPTNIDSSTLPPTLLFSEHEKYSQNDRIDMGVKNENIADDDPATKPAGSFSSQESVRPTVLKLRGVNACPVKEEVVAPFWANNTRGEVLALLNMYPFEQYVHWEKCTNENKQMYCREGCRCEQQYRLHRLLAYDPSNECRGIFSDWFRFPSCCVCRCYDIPLQHRAASRSPRLPLAARSHIYQHAAADWYTIGDRDPI